jgi:hypothetical protein
LPLLALALREEAVVCRLVVILSLRYYVEGELRLCGDGSQHHDDAGNRVK